MAKKKMTKKLMGAIGEGFGLEVAQELLDIAERVVVAKRISKDLLFKCPHCRGEISFKVAIPRAGVSFELKE